MTSESHMKEGGTAGFVYGGQGRAWRALFANVKSEVENAYRKELQEATPWRRVFLQLKVRREIQQRLEDLAPRDALYLHRSVGRKA